MKLRTINRKANKAPQAQVPAGPTEALFRLELGEVLREYRNRQGRTLREVSSEATVSLGYLSEVERGQKEASSELLSSICQALNVPLSQVLRVVADRVDLVEGRIPPSMIRTVRVSEMSDEMIAEVSAR